MIATQHQRQPPYRFGDLKRCNPAALKLLRDAVEQQELERKPSRASAQLEELSFIKVAEADFWTKKVMIKPTLWGEEALEEYEETNA